MQRVVWPLASYSFVYRDILSIRNQRAVETGFVQVMFRSEGMYGVCNAPDFHVSLGERMHVVPGLPEYVFDECEPFEETELTTGVK